MGFRDNLALAEAAGLDMSSYSSGKSLLSRSSLMPVTLRELVKWTYHLCTPVQYLLIETSLDQSLNAIILSEPGFGRVALRRFARVHTQISSSPDLPTVARVLQSKAPPLLLLFGLGGKEMRRCTRTRAKPPH